MIMESIIARISKFRNNLNLPGVFYGLLVFLLCLTSFMFGKLTSSMENTPSFTFESKEVEEQNFQKEKDDLFGKVSTSTIVASITGKKYYFVWCKGAINIKDSKKIYFDSEDLAQKAGYTIAANCK